MATYLTGNDGSVTWPTTWGVATLLNTWSASFSRTATDVTAFGDTGKRRKLGILDITGSCGGHMQSNVANSEPGSDLIDGDDLNGSQLILISSSVSTVCSFQFTAVLSQMQINVDKMGDSTASFNFEISNGTLPVVSWDEAS